jgi:hypothetical protein
MAQLSNLTPSQIKLLIIKTTSFIRYRIIDGFKIIKDLDINIGDYIFAHNGRDWAITEVNTGDILKGTAKYNFISESDKVPLNKKYTGSDSVILKRINSDRDINLAKNIFSKLHDEVSHHVGNLYSFIKPEPKSEPKPEPDATESSGVNKGELFLLSAGVLLFVIIFAAIVVYLFRHKSQSVEEPSLPDVPIYMI